VHCCGTFTPQHHALAKHSSRCGAIPQRCVMSTMHSAVPCWIIPACGTKTSNPDAQGGGGHGADAPQLLLAAGLQRLFGLLHQPHQLSGDTVHQRPHAAGAADAPEMQLSNSNCLCTAEGIGCLQSGVPSNQHASGFAGCLYLHAGMQECGSMLRASDTRRTHNCLSSLCLQLESLVCV